jgi:hypothetical protein
MTDRAIAQHLYLTRRTVETHLGHVFAKLDVPAGSNQNRRVHAVRRYSTPRRNRARPANPTRSLDDFPLVFDHLFSGTRCQPTPGSCCQHQRRQYRWSTRSGMNS